MRAIRSAVCLVMLCLTTTATCWAADAPSRPATKQDLIGTWRLVSVRPVHDANDPTFFPYQQFQFNSNASMKFISSETALTKEWQDKFQKQPSEIDFTVNDRGILTLTWSKLAHSENAVTSFVLRDVPQELLLKMSPEARKGLPKKGNITLSFLNSKGKIAYQKVLERIA